MPTYPWNHPSGWIRRDLYERGEGHDANFVYMSLETLRARHLDPYGVDLGIVEPDEAAVFSVLPNPSSLPACAPRTTTGCSTTGCCRSRGCAG